MQNNLKNSKRLNWEKLENHISITHFSSNIDEVNQKSSEIYVKRFERLDESTDKNMTIFLLHDLGQYHGRFSQLIDWNREKNPEISFIAMDFSGHGLSSGTRGHFESFDHLVNDLYFLLTQIEKNEAQNEKWILLGHGVGGLVALDLLNRFQSKIGNMVDGLILSNFISKFTSPVLDFDNQFSSKIKGIKKILSHSRPYRLNKGQDVLTSPDEILKYEHDPLIIHRPTLNSIREVQTKIANIYQDSYFLDAPVLILESYHLPSLKSSGMSYFSKGIKKNLLTEKKYSLMKYDLYNELNNEEVFNDISNWMKIYEN